MKIYNIEDTIGGWFIGDFPKAIYQTKGFEVSLKRHKVGEFWDLHYQENSLEINLLVEGEIVMNGQIIKQNEIFVMYPYEITDVRFTKDCTVVCVKVPSLPNDKVVVKKEEV